MNHESVLHVFVRNCESHVLGEVPLVEFMYCVFTRTLSELKSLLLCSREVFRALINSLVR